MKYNERYLADHQIPALVYLLNQLRKLYLDDAPIVRSKEIERLHSMLSGIETEKTPSAKTLSRTFAYLRGDTGKRPDMKDTVEVLLQFYSEDKGLGILYFEEFVEEFQNEIDAYFSSLKFAYEIKKENCHPDFETDIEEVEEQEADLSELGQFYETIDQQTELDSNFWLIAESKTSTNSNKPVLALINDIDLNDPYWKNKAFAIQLLLTENIEIEKEPDRIVLKISTKKEPYGIYNNRGKQFIRSWFSRSEKERKELFSFNEKLKNFLYAESNGSIFKLKNHPYRWASGGAIPIVNYQNKKWLLTFFRDIAPLGWNIANGASENKAERENLNRVIFREFSEEINLFSDHPLERRAMIQKQFYLPEMTAKDSFLSPSFYIKQHRLRGQQDGLRIGFDKDSKNKVRIKTIPTPFDLEVDQEHDYCREIIFNINPFEYGIEILRLLMFNMKDEDYILDGEMHESDLFLMRRPPMLISIDFLREKFEKDGKLGELVKGNKNAQESISLSNIPKSAFKIFGADIELKKRRINDPKNKNQLEKRFYSDWLGDFQKPFRQIVGENDESIADIQGEDNPLTWLCPVTWKSLEMAFRLELI
ncbi:MAG: hypothetical protein GQ574_26660 [Crocinitomix sp.]|nr:hypothetical protein [Crocinitomix sp.]